MDEELLNILRLIKDRWGRETVEAIVRKIDEYPIQYKGTLRRSISYSQDDNIDGEIQFNMADYGKFIDEGIGTFGPRNQAIPKTSIPGIAFYLKPWADSKGLNAWAVATNIVKRGGIKPRPFFNSVIEERIELLGNDITTALNEFMELQVQRYNEANK